MALNRTKPAFILPFEAAGLELENAGGKGVNLARLAAAGYPVPGGFIITTTAYQSFVAENGLDEILQRILAGHNLSDLTELESASSEIRQFFTDGAIPSDLAEQILQAYRALGAPPVAVRSSATAEDLPDVSFAGQQETFLNVVNEAALLKSVVGCWSSLWTGRAMGYRIRQGIVQRGLSLAVVVQSMVESEVSGVMFTANPLSGLRSQVVIDATFGLGEALVSGQVEPDHYVVDSVSGTVVEKTLGSKAMAIRARREGGTSAGLEDAAARQALTDGQILDLARLGQQVAADYSFPQDIEWALAGGELYLLQSRPVTSLFPLPVRPNGEPLEVYFSFAAVQGMLDPMTPLGRDFIRQLFAIGAGLWGYQRTAETQAVVYTAGERLWIRITPLLCNTLGREVTAGALRLVEPTILKAVNLIIDDPCLKPGRSGVRLETVRHAAHFIPRLAWNVLLNLISPEKRRQKIVDNGERVLAEMRQRSRAVQGDQNARLQQRTKLLIEVAQRDLPRSLILYVSGVASGMAPFNLLNNLSKQAPRDPQAAASRGWNDLALEITRGLPHNPTTEMDLLLWDTAETIRRDPASAQLFAKLEANQLSQRYLAGTLPGPAQAAIAAFMGKYGGRGLGEIDLGRARWLEEPDHVMQVLGSFLQIEDVSQAPNAVFQRGSQQAEAAIRELSNGLHKLPGGWLKAFESRWAAWRVRALLGMREEPKFFAVRMMGILRQSLLESGADFVATGQLDRPDDVVYLNLAELDALAKGSLPQSRALVASRRASYARELRRRQVPRLLLSDGRAFYEGVSSDFGANSLTGAPVSPGVVEGPVRVILDPRGAQLQPGEIMVCPGTDPSWTPLFLAAGGLIMEVGGMMTHGAVVAREYGIPAVVGVQEATTCLKDGQRIRLDGSSGRIDLL